MTLPARSCTADCAHCSSTLLLPQTPLPLPITSAAASSAFSALPCNQACQVTVCREMLMEGREHLEILSFSVVAALAEIYCSIVSPCRCQNPDPCNDNSANTAKPCTSACCERRVCLGEAGGCDVAAARAQGGLQVGGRHGVEARVVVLEPLRQALGRDICLEAGTTHVEAVCMTRA